MKLLDSVTHTGVEGSLDARGGSRKPIEPVSHRSNKTLKSESVSRSLSKVLRFFAAKLRDSARNVGGKFWEVVKEKLVMLFRRVVLFARNVGGNRGTDNKGRLRPKFEWPYVMNSSVAMHRPLASGTWIWHHQHARWHHRYYRTRR